MELVRRQGRLRIPQSYLVMRRSGHERTRGGAALGAAVAGRSLPADAAMGSSSDEKNDFARLLPPLRAVLCSLLPGGGAEAGCCLLALRFRGDWVEAAPTGSPALVGEAAGQLLLGVKGTATVVSQSVATSSFKK